MSLSCHLHRHVINTETVVAIVFSAVRSWLGAQQINIDNIHNGLLLFDAAISRLFIGSQPVNKSVVNWLEICY